MLTKKVVNRLALRICGPMMLIIVPATFAGSYGLISERISAAITLLAMTVGTVVMSRALKKNMQDSPTKD
jgi:hypothetical protein